MFAFTRTHTAVSYMPKRGKTLLLLSTRHQEAAVSSGEKIFFIFPFRFWAPTPAGGGQVGGPRYFFTTFWMECLQRVPYMDSHQSILAKAKELPEEVVYRGAGEDPHCPANGKEITASTYTKFCSLGATSTTPSTSQSPNTTQRRQCVVGRHKRQVCLLCTPNQT